MKLSDYIGKILFIRQRSFWKREFEFISDNELIGELKYPKFLSDRVECTIGNERFTFSRPNIFSNEVEIRKHGYELPIAKMNSNFFATKGSIDLPRGKKVTMKFGLLNNRVEIYCNENELLVSLHYKISFKEKCEINIEKRSAILDDYPWIILLAFYYIQLKRRNTGIIH